MLKFVQPHNLIPASFIVDPSDTFEPGMIAQCKLYGNHRRFESLCTLKMIKKFERKKTTL